MENKILVRVDLFGEKEYVNHWMGYIYGMTKEEFLELREQYKHDFKSDILLTWYGFLEENNIKYEKIEFDIDEF